MKLSLNSERSLTLLNPFIDIFCNIAYHTNYLHSTTCQAYPRGKSNFAGPILYIIQYFFSNNAELEDRSSVIQVNPDVHTTRRLVQHAAIFSTNGTTNKNYDIVYTVEVTAENKCGVKSNATVCVVNNTNTPPKHCGATANTSQYTLKILIVSVAIMCMVLMMT